MQTRACCHKTISERSQVKRMGKKGRNSHQGRGIYPLKMGKDQKNYLIIVLCLFSITMIAYGIACNNNIIFIVGLILVIGCYIFIRKRLKEHARKL